MFVARDLLFDGGGEIAWRSASRASLFRDRRQERSRFPSSRSPCPPPVSTYASPRLSLSSTRRLGTHAPIPPDSASRKPPANDTILLCLAHSCSRWNDRNRSAPARGGRRRMRSSRTRMGGWSQRRPPISKRIASANMCSIRTGRGPTSKWAAAIIPRFRSPCPSRP